MANIGAYIKRKTEIHNEISKQWEPLAMHIFRGINDRIATPKQTKWDTYQKIPQAIVNTWEPSDGLMPNRRAFKPAVKAALADFRQSLSNLHIDRLSIWSGNIVDDQYYITVSSLAWRVKLTKLLKYDMDGLGDLRFCWGFNDGAYVDGDVSMLRLDILEVADQERVLIAFKDFWQEYTTVGALAV